MSKGNKVIKEIRNLGINSGTVDCLHLNLNSLHSVRQFAKTFLGMNLPLHLLINNGDCIKFAKKYNNHA
jgi:hypothetical protein